ncbi:Protein Aster-A [Mytilus edulis]|uniref:Protein Aster-A n=1 Tax=Mytilus edulis TaxID=6550 RepID=A0A8S3QZQ5_MYTED|nr:Protein Aster-A [Mytilus edulis]
MQRQVTESTSNDPFTENRIDSDNNPVPETPESYPDTDNEESGSLSVSATVAGAFQNLISWSSNQLKKSGDSTPLSEGSQESMNLVGSDMSSDSPGKSGSPSKNSSSNEYTEHEVARFSCGDGEKSAPDLLTVTKSEENEFLKEKVVLRTSSFKRNERSSSASLGVRSGNTETNMRSERSSSASLASGSRASDIIVSKSDRSSGNSTLGLKANTSSNQRSSIVIEKSSDSPGSRSSVELNRNHSREHSFEKSLENIIDKCSEKSLDLNLTVDSKTDVKNGLSDPSKSLDEAASSTSAKKSEKKKKGTPWYSAMFSPTYKSRSEDFRKFFKDLPNDERLIVDYSCALQRDILVHGRMYITQNWICFYANIFRWETVLTITAKEISAVTKEKTARVIPNAIQVTTNKDKYFFTSFGARDKTYLMLFRIWQNALLDQPMTPPEMWQWVHMSYGDELGLTSSDDDYVPPYNGLEEQDEEEEEEECEDKIEKEVTEDVALIPPAKEEDSLIADMYHKAIDKKEDEEVPTDGEITCTSLHQHVGKVSHNDVYPVSVDKMFQMIFTDTAFMTSVHEARRSYDINLPPWQEEDGQRLRMVRYKISLNYSIGPKSSQTSEKQTCLKESKPGSLYVIDCECCMNGIPYGDTFMVVNRYCLTRVLKNRSRLKVTTEIRYKKSVWGIVKNMIEKNGYEGVKDFFKFMDLHLKQECEKERSIQTLRSHNSKHKLRKRRTRSNVLIHNMKENPKIKATRHLSLNETAKHHPPVAAPLPVRNTFASVHTVYKEEGLSKLNADTLVRVILVILVLLVIFNAVLFYKLWSLEGYANILYFPHSQTSINVNHVPKSEEDWIQLLKQQQSLHESEMHKWKEILSSSITMIDQMKSSLTKLSDTLENHISHADMYSRAANQE